MAPRSPVYSMVGIYSIIITVFGWIGLIGSALLCVAWHNAHSYMVAIKQPDKVILVSDIFAGVVVSQWTMSMVALLAYAELMKAIVESAKNTERVARLAANATKVSR